jgi:serine protease Do
MNRKKLFTVAASVVLVFALAGPLAAQNPSSWRSSVTDLQTAFREVSKQVLPEVVEIDVVNVVERQTVNPFEFFFNFPFGPQQGPQAPSQPKQQYKQEGLGSGVIVEKRDKTVYILTNNHVVQGADEINISLYDGRKFTGELVGTDPLKDLALVSFETREDIPIAKLGDSDSMQVGDWVLAIGNPYGLESTVTAGIVSARGRNVSPGDQSFTDYIQTDAAINPGNSGGALVNLNGEVIGINTWIASKNGGNVGLGFAIPINNARRAINEFIETGSVQYAWLGVNMGDPTPLILEEMGLKDKQGAFVFNLYSDSPAMEGGILPGDLITRFGNTAITNSNDLSRAVATFSPGQNVSVDVIRDGRELSLNIRLDVRTIENQEIKPALWPGFSVVPLNKELQEQLRLPRNAGNVIIGAVAQDSPAAALGIRSGDVVRSINRRSVRNLQQFYEMISEGDSISLRVLRGDQELTFTLNK